MVGNATLLCSFAAMATVKIFVLDDNFKNLHFRVSAQEKKKEKKGGRRFETCYVGWQKRNNASSFQQHQ
jgi:hypothetical protein